jgi:hypothetical protein
MQITIGSTVINFPESANNPNWADQIILFAQAVESALSSLVGEFDIPQRVMNIDALINTGSFTDITDGVVPLSLPSVAFPASGARAAHIKYAFYRKTDDNIFVETGVLLAVYDGAWTWSKDAVGTEEPSSIEFNITNPGQVQFKFNTSLSGINPEGRITYSAEVLKQS